MTPERKGTIQ